MGLAREGVRELLPCEQEKAGAEAGGANGAKDLEPGLVEVGTAGVGEESETVPGGMGGEDAA